MTQILFDFELSSSYNGSWKTQLDVMREWWWWRFIMSGDTIHIINAFPERIRTAVEQATYRWFHRRAVVAWRWHWKRERHARECHPYRSTFQIVRNDSVWAKPGTRKCTNQTDRWMCRLCGKCACREECCLRLLRFVIVSCMERASKRPTGTIASLAPLEALLSLISNGYHCTHKSSVRSMRYIAVRRLHSIHPSDAHRHHFSLPWDIVTTTRAFIVRSQ